MQIDWLTVVAQIVNFLVLVWLLKHFLYQPILDAMSRREQRIAQELESAREREHDAEQNRQAYLSQMEELETSRQKLIEQARNQATEERSRLLEEARQEVAQQRHLWIKQLNEEKSDFLKTLRAQLTDAVQHVNRRVLADLANLSLEAFCVKVFIDKLAALNEQTRSPFANTSTSLQIATAFPLTPELSHQLTAAVHELLNPDVDIQFLETPELICGIALTSGDHRLDWNVDDYLSELEENVNRFLDMTTG